MKIYTQSDLAYIVEPSDNPQLSEVDRILAKL